MKKHFWWIALILILVGMGFIMNFGISKYFNYDRYEGKVAFWTEQEYITFKETLAWNSVKDFKVTVLQSEMPIIVKLDYVKVKAGSYFPYGERGWLDKTQNAQWLLYIGIPLLVTGVILANKGED